MELELRLDPDDAPRLLRHSLLAAATRSRPLQQSIVWHDTAALALAADGLAAVKTRQGWRLEGLMPRSRDIWPPGAPPPLLAEAATPEELGHTAAEQLAPVVGFSGRRQTLALTTPQGSLTLTLLRGAVRAVTAEHAIARIVLGGDASAVLALALSLSDAVHAEVACRSLAAEALALTRGAVTGQEHGRAAAIDLPEPQTVPRGFVSVLATLSRAILELAPAAMADRQGPEPVHHMRVALRRLRSAITVFRPVLDCAELQAAAAGLKALSARLGPTRDWDVFLSETLPPILAAFPGETRVERLATAAKRRRQECQSALAEFLRGDEFRRLGIELAWLAGTESWFPATDEDLASSLTALAADILRRRWRKLQSQDDLESLDAPALHGIRLRAKRARYAAEMFAPLFGGKAPRRFIERLADVQEGLGVLNDRSTAERLMDELGGAGGRHAYAAGLVLGYAAASSGEFLPKVVRRWEKLQRAPRFWERDSGA